MPADFNSLTGTLKPQNNGPLIAIRWFVHWLLMGGLLHLVQRGGAWAGPQPAQAPPRCSKCNSPPINDQCTNSILFNVALFSSLFCLFRQPLSDDEVATRLRHLYLSLVRFTAFPMLSSISLTSYFILSLQSPFLWWSSSLLSSFNITVHCPRWQPSFIHSWHTTEPGKSSSHDWFYQPYFPSVAKSVLCRYSLSCLSSLHGVSSWARSSPPL